MITVFFLAIALLSLGKVRSRNLIANDRYWYSVKILVVVAILFSLLDILICFLLVV